MNPDIAIMLGGQVRDFYTHPVTAQASEIMGLIPDRSWADVSSSYIHVGIEVREKTELADVIKLVESSLPPPGTDMPLYEMFDRASQVLGAEHIIHYEDPRTVEGMIQSLPIGFARRPVGVLIPYQGALVLGSKDLVEPGQGQYSGMGHVAVYPGFDITTSQMFRAISGKLPRDYRDFIADKPLPEIVQGARHKLAGMSCYVQLYLIRKIHQ